MLADPLVSFLDFYWNFDLDFLILACSFYECTELIAQICKHINNKGSRVYLGTLIRMEKKDKIYYQIFTTTLKTCLEEKRKEEDELFTEWRRLNTRQSEPVSFETIYRNLSRQ